MSDELWETIDWGDDDDNDTINQEDHSFVSSTIDTKEIAGTIRLSGASLLCTPGCIYSVRVRRHAFIVHDEPEKGSRVATDEKR